MADFSGGRPSLPRIDTTMGQLPQQSSHFQLESHYQHYQQEYQQEYQQDYQQSYQQDYQQDYQRDYQQDYQRDYHREFQEEYQHQYQPDYQQPQLRPQASSQLQEEQQQSQPIPEMLVEDRLLSAVANVLGIPKDTIDLIDSFTDLGGDEVSAQVLQKTCTASGLNMTTKDILRCQTLAELQTCITPFESPAEPVDKDSEYDSEPSEVFSDDIARNTSDEDVQSFSGSQSQQSQTMSAHRDAVEKLILSTPHVSGAAIVKPRAGFLEDKLVAFISLRSPDGHEAVHSPSVIQVISQSQMHFAGSHVAAIRLALEQSAGHLTMPHNWIVVDQVPITEQGDADRRKLQTWVQNMNEDTYRQICSLQSDEIFQEPLTDTERTIQQAVSRVLRISEAQVGMNFSFAQLGGDDVSTMLLIAACRAQGVTLRPEDILQSTSLSQVASLASHKSTLSKLWNEESLEGFKLSPMQQFYFDTPTGCRLDERMKMDGSYRFNQSILLKVNKSTTLEDIHAAVEAVVAHHSMLRSRFRSDAEGWTQRLMPGVKGTFGFSYHNVCDFDAVLNIIEQAQVRIDIENGPVFDVEHFRLPDGQQMIFLVAHQLVVDLLSWRIIIHDLEELLKEGTLYSERSMPFQTWNELQEKEIERSSDATPLPFDLTSCDFAYWGLEESLNTYGETIEASFTISAELTAILHTTCNQVFRTDSADIYVAALFLSFCQTFPDHHAPTIWNQEHGREPWSPDIDVTETVGWFTSLCPMGLRFENTGDFIQVLRDMKDTRRSIPHRGWDYFASRYFGPYAASRCADGWPFEIMFSYAGAAQQLERENGVLEHVRVPQRVFGAGHSNHGSQVSRMAIFEASVTVDNGCATVSVMYNRGSRNLDKIGDWIQTYEHLLYEAVGRLRYRAQELTLADVPLLNTTYEGLAKLNGDRLLALGLPSARDIEDVYPVTANQQEILLTQTQSLELCHSTSIYELTLLNGAQADQSHICTVWQQIVAKHPALRTVFIDSITEDGLFDQVILRRCSPNMFFFDANPDTDPITALKTLPALPTNPSQPRHRLSVCNSESGTYLRLEASQAICDLPSLQLLMSDLKRIYNSGKTPLKSVDPSHTACLQYIDSCRKEDRLAFWQERLQDSQPCHFPQLLTGTEKQAIETHHELDIDAGQVDEFCRDNSVSRSTVLRVAWGLVLRAYTGSNKVCFGSRVSGREGEGAPKDVHQATGCFENTVPCTMALWAYQSIEAVVRDAEDEFHASLPHQFVSISELEHNMGLKGEKLFNTIMSHMDEPPALKSRFSSTRPQLALTCAQSFCSSACDISILTMFADGGLTCGISQRILNKKQTDSLALAFSQAIRSIVSSPLASIGGVNLSADENTALLASSKIDLLEPCVHGLISNRARATPEAPAVCAGDGDFSYKSLSRLVQRLASYLTRWGVRPGVAVPVVLGKTRWSVVSILGIMKAGGCFVPIDGDDPVMVEAIVKQITPQVILVTGMVAPNLHLFAEGVIVVNEALFSAQLPTDSPTRKASGDDAACILFPAGSSRTKDVRGFTYSHTALSCALLAQGLPLKIDQTSRVLQVSSFSVDTALVETLTTLVHGGCICMPSATERKRDIDGAIRRMEVNWTYMTPILARRLKPAAVPSLKVTCFRTRGLDEDTCGPWMKATKVILAYGCLEICPLGISAIEVTSTDELDRIAPPFLGKFWVANPEDASKVVPNGAVGELCIESPTMAQKFVAGQPLMPPTQENEQTQDGRQMVRYIKTSQRVRVVDEGIMELLPSSRHDMSIDGKVIPAAKVEQHLRRCLGQGIDVAVEALTCPDSPQLLAAFIQLDAMFDGPEDLTKLTMTTRERAYFAKKFAVNSLRESLPSYMIPTVFIPVKRLPVTTAMKVNRRKLQKMARGLSAEQLLAITDVPSPKQDRNAHIKPLPLTQVEERMRTIWAKLLGIEEVSIIDGAQSFVKLGGGGFLAAQMVVECRKEGMMISVQDVLRGASLTELCQGITLGSDAAALVPGAQPAGGQPVSAKPVALLSEDFIEEAIAPKLGIERKVIKDVAEATSSQIRSLELGLLKDRGDVSYLTFNFTGLDNSKKLEAACFGICMIHPILRTAFVVHGRKVYQVAVRSFSPEFQRIQCPSWRLSNTTEKIIKQDQAIPLVLTTPITKFFYLDGGKQSTLIMRLSKAQYDEVSIPLLVQDLRRFYASSQGNLRRPTYFELVRSAQLAHSQGAEEYWRSLLDGAEMTRVIAHTTPPSMSAAIRSIRQILPTTSLASIGISFDTVVKAAWAMELAKLSGCSDVLFGEIVEGRHMRLADGLSATGVLGPAKNTIPVRVRFGDSPSTPMDLLQAVHGQRAMGVPFENSGWLDMVKDYTKSPYWTRFSTAVHHQSPDSNRQAPNFKFGPASCKFSILESAFQDVHDFLVSSSKPEQDKAEIVLTFCETRIPVFFAEELLKSLCSTIEMLTSVSMMHPLIPSAQDFVSMQRRIPLPQPITDVPQIRVSSSDLPKEFHFAVQSLIAAAWTHVLDPRALGVPESHLHNAAFYDLWGSLIPAMQLAKYLTREVPSLGIPGLEKVHFTMEDVIAHPTMIGQFELVAKKRLDREQPTAARSRLSSVSSSSLSKSLRRLSSTMKSTSRRTGSNAGDSPGTPSGIRITHPHLNPPANIDVTLAKKHQQQQPIIKTPTRIQPLAEMGAEEVLVEEPAKEQAASDDDRFPGHNTWNSSQWPSGQQQQQQQHQQTGQESTHLQQQVSQQQALYQQQMFQQQGHQQQMHQQQGHSQIQQPRPLRQQTRGLLLPPQNQFEGMRERGRSMENLSTPTTATAKAMTTTPAAQQPRANHEEADDVVMPLGQWRWPRTEQPNDIVSPLSPQLQRTQSFRRTGTGFLSNRSGSTASQSAKSTKGGEKEKKVRQRASTIFGHMPYVSPATALRTGASF